MPKNSDLESYLKTQFFGMVSIMSGYIAFEKFLEVANAKAIALQYQLAKSPELTQEVYDAAKELGRKLSLGDLYTGLFYAGMAGISFAIMIYEAYRKKDHKKE